MLAQINSARGVFVVLVLALLLSGCTPAGPRALLKGKKCLDHGDVSGAVTEFSRATTLLATNANAWNYLAVALHRAGQAEEAANAYQTALRLNHDLAEAHYNLGVLWLEQNRPDLARAELTAYTLRRPNDGNGWLKLGFALLKENDLPMAERSFSTVLSLKTDDAEAYNGLGLARLQAGKFRDAEQFFAAAVQARPNFGPALENLATVNLQYLHDTKAALADYDAYLGIIPRPANYYEVKSLVAGLTQTEAPASPAAPAVPVRTSPPPAELSSKTTVFATSRPAPIERREPQETQASHPAEFATHVSHPYPTATLTTPAEHPIRTEIVHVRPGPEIIVSAKTNANRPGRPTPQAIANPTVNNPAPGEPLEVLTPEEAEPRPGFWHRLFQGDKPSDGTSTAKRYHDINPPEESTPAAPPAVTPLPQTVSGSGDELATTKPEAKPVETKPQPVIFPRYAYTAPTRPAPGNRASAEGGFTKARLAEQDENWVEAEQWYQMAANTDPAWFEAQYNAGVIAHRLRNYSTALPRYELALAIQPDSVDARYNFALALKAAGYPLDAANELKKILAGNPDEVRAHLALANLYAQALHDAAQARQHYLRVLALQPENPQAADIRFWLSANSGAKKSD